MDNYTDTFSAFAVGAFTPEPINMSITGTSDPADWFVDLLGGSETDSGERVDSYTILTSGPVWQAVTILSGSVMSLPLEVIETISDNPRRTRKAQNLPPTRLIENEPHPEFLPSLFKEMMTAWAAIYGNAIARIDKANSVPLQLTPLLPKSVRLERDEEGQLWYMHRKSDELIRRLGGNVPSEEEPLKPDDVFHIRGPHGGLWGTSLIDVAKNSIGHALALEKHGNSIFKNAARPSGVLQKDGKMLPEARRNLRKEWREIHAGAHNAGNIMILPDGLKYNPLGMTMEDAQWLEARRFSREEMASWFNLPAHMLNALENSSVRANLEEQNKSFFFHSLTPWLIRWQDEALRKLMSMTARRSGRFKCKFNAKALIAADFSSQIAGFATARQWGWMSANDVLEELGRDDIGEKGDIYMVPSNMANAETGEPFSMSQQPEPEVDEESEGDEQTEDEEETSDSFNQNGDRVAAMRPAFIHELRRVMNHEANCIKKAAKRCQRDKSVNFCSFVDDYYADEFVNFATEQMHTLSSVFAVDQRNLNLDPLTTSYAEDSKDFWLSVAAISQPDTLYLNVTERLNKWKDRAYLAADMILEQN